VKNFTTVLKIAPAFLLASTVIHAQKKDSLPQEKKIEEVVLIGYGKQKKSDLTGSITSVTAKDFNGGATSAGQLIQGKTPGVQITNNSGAPGSGTKIRIRGTSSLSGENSPLIVIDGVPQDFVGMNGVSDPLSLINPNDIETFDILKDASATAIYGNRASNGVILVTTKKGTAGKFKLNFSTLTSVSTKMGKVDVLNAQEFRDFVNGNPYASANYKAKLGKADTDWQDQIYQAAWGTDNNVAFSGGIKGLPYRLSLGYNEQNGIVKSNSFRRTSVGLNLNPKFFDNHLSVNVNAKGTFTDNRFVDGEVIKAATYFDPTQPVYSGNSNYGGYYEWLDSGSATGYNVNGNKNPVGLINGIRDVSSVTRGLGNIQLDYKFHFLPDLHFNVNAGYDYTKSEGHKFKDGNLRAGFEDKGSSNFYSMEKKNKLLETYFNYVKNINAINTGVDITAGYSYQDFNILIPGAITYRGTGINSQDLNFETRNTLISFYGRAIFTVANKYILSGSIRRDGSSRFYNGTRDNVWGVFPGVSLAWKLNEESFIKNISSISTLKLRAGWGKTGQQELPALDGNKPNNYPAFAAYNPSYPEASYQFGNEFYFMFRPANYNPNLTWETTTTKNLGLDFGFNKNRITGSIDVFRKDTKDLLVYADEPAGGLSNASWQNVGDMKNEGIEGSITVIPVKNQNTTWEVSFNATHYKPVITKLKDRADESFNMEVGGIEGGSGNRIQAHAVGYAPNSFWVYQQVYDSNGKPVDGAFVDRNGDGMISTKDMYYYKSTTPDAILGFSTKVSHKNWDFALSARAVLGNYVYNNAASNSSLQSVSTNEYLQNVFATAPQYQFSVPQYKSDIYVENASFLRLDNINVGYNFGEIFTKGSNLKVYAMAQNVFVITKYSGVDPEVFTGIDNGYYQMPRIYSLGFNFQF